MVSLVFFIIGFALSLILKSAGVGYDMWQFYGVVGCLLAAIIAFAILFE